MKAEQTILEMLKEKPEDFVSGEDISGRCGTVGIPSNQLQADTILMNLPPPI